MTMRIKDVAPNEASLAALAERLEKACLGGEPLTQGEIDFFLASDPAFLETAKTILRELILRMDHPAEK